MPCRLDNGIIHDQPFAAATTVESLVFIAFRHLSNTKSASHNSFMSSPNALALVNTHEVRYSYKARDRIWQSHVKLLGSWPQHHSTVAISEASIL